MASKLDHIYRSLRLVRYFVRGWGEPENLKRLCEFRKVVGNRETCSKLVSPDYPVVIEKEQEDKDCITIDGYFTSPLIHYLPEVVPESCRTAYFQYVLPKKWASDNYKPVILHLAGTGDQYFWRRRNLIAKPLIREAGIGSIILENPFYGLRKPEDQFRTILKNVSDILVMGGCLTLESSVLFHLSERMGLGPLGITGLSMGGHMATIAATAWPKPLVIVPCLAGMTASYVFTQGAVSHAINWKMLQKEYLSKSIFKDEVQKMVHIIEGDAFSASQELAKNLAKGADFGCASEIDSVRVSKALQQITNEESSCLYGQIQSSTFSQPLFYGDEDVANKSACDDNLNISNKTSATSGKVDVTKAVKANANSKAELESSESTATALLNLIVRLARASVNLSILSSSKETETGFKQNETTSDGQEAVKFMHGIMDECTHLKQFAVPVDTSLAIAVCADQDAYIPRKARCNFTLVWPGSEVRYVKGGHVRSYVQYQKEFRTAIIDAFSRYRVKYIDKNSKNDSTCR